MPPTPTAADEMSAERLRELLARCTPGEWYAITRQGSWDWLVAVEGGDLEICQMFHDGTEMNERGEANARLVALAPSLAARLCEVEAANAWQPIETAPRDGTHVMVYGPHFRDQNYTDICTFYKGKWTITFMHEHGDPTHWRPLPAPPAANGKEEK